MQGPIGANVSNPFARVYLNFLPLQLARGDVDEARQSEHVLHGLIGRYARRPLPYHDAELGLVMDFADVRRNPNRIARANHRGRRLHEHERLGRQRLVHLRRMVLVVQPDGDDLRRRHRRQHARRLHLSARFRSRFDELLRRASGRRTHRLRPADMCRRTPHAYRALPSCSTRNSLRHASTNRLLDAIRRRAPVRRRRSIDRDDLVHVGAAAPHGAVQERRIGNRRLRQRGKFVTWRLAAQDQVATEIGLGIGLPEQADAVARRRCARAISAAPVGTYRPASRRPGCSVRSRCAIVPAISTRRTT